MSANKKRLQITLTDEQFVILENLAKEKGFTKSAVIALALETYSERK